MFNWFLDRYDNEGHEYEIRWQVWKMKWFPYRTYEYLGHDKETLEIKFGPRIWNKPDIFRNKDEDVIS